MVKLNEREAFVERASTKKLNKYIASKRQAQLFDLFERVESRKRCLEGWLWTEEGSKPHKSLRAGRRESVTGQASVPVLFCFGRTSLQILLSFWSVFFFFSMSRRHSFLCLREAKKIT